MITRVMKGIQKIQQVIVFVPVSNTPRKVNNNNNNNTFFFFVSGAHNSNKSII